MIRSCVLLATCIGALLAVPSSGLAATSWNLSSVVDADPGPSGSTVPGTFGAIAPDPGGGYVGVASIPQPFGTVRYNAAGVALGPAGPTGMNITGRGMMAISEMAQAADGTMYFLDSLLSRVVITNSLGEQVGSFGSGGMSPGEFNLPLGIAVAPDGTVLVADTGNDRIQRFTSGGVHLATYGNTGSLDGEFSQPSSVAANPDGSFWVVDTGNDRVQRLAADGTHQLTFGSSGSGDGEFDNATRIARAPSGEILIIDRAQHRVQRFTSSGGFLNHIGESGAGALTAPRAVAVLSTEEVLVTDESSYSVRRFALDGTYIGRRHEGPATARDLQIGINAIAHPSQPGTLLINKSLPNDPTPRLRACSYDGLCSETTGDYSDYGALVSLRSLTDGTLVGGSAGEGLLRLDTQGERLGVLIPPGPNPGEAGLVSAIFVEGDDIWAVDADRAIIHHVRADGTYLGSTPLPIAPFYTFGFARLSNGDFLLSGHAIGSDRLMRIDGSGGLIWERTDATDALEGGGIVLQSDSTFLLATSELTHRRVSDGSVIQSVSVPQSSTGFITSMTSLQRLPDGRLIASDPMNARLLYFTLVTTPLTVTPTVTPPQVVTAGSGVLSFAVIGAVGRVSYSASWQGRSAPITNAGAIDLARLPEGRSVLRVVAVDADQNQAVWEQIIVVDRTAPIVVAPRFATRSTLSVKVQDALTAPTAARQSVRLRAVGRSTIRVTVADTAGNRAVRTVVVNRRPSLIYGSRNRGAKLWRPGRPALFTPGEEALRAVFGVGGSVESTPYSPALVREVQFRLKKLGQLSVVVRSSGRIDRTTSAALRRYQRARRLARTGTPNLATRRALDKDLTRIFAS